MKPAAKKPSVRNPMESTETSEGLGANPRNRRKREMFRVRWWVHPDQSGGPMKADFATRAEAKAHAQGLRESFWTLRSSRSRPSDGLINMPGVRHWARARLSSNRATVPNHSGPI